VLALAPAPRPGASARAPRQGDAGAWALRGPRLAPPGEPGLLGLPARAGGALATCSTYAPRAAPHRPGARGTCRPGVLAPTATPGRARAPGGAPGVGRARCGDGRRPLPWSSPAARGHGRRCTFTVGRAHPGGRCRRVAAQPSRAETAPSGCDLLSALKASPRPGPAPGGDTSPSVGGARRAARRRQAAVATQKLNCKRAMR